MSSNTKTEVTEFQYLDECTQRTWKAKAYADISYDMSGNAYVDDINIVDFDDNMPIEALEWLINMMKLHAWVIPNF